MRSRIYIVPRNTFELYLNNDIQHRVGISAASENKKYYITALSKIEADSGRKSNKAEET